MTYDSHANFMSARYAVETVIRDLNIFPLLYVPNALASTYSEKTTEET